ncbi:hypothetical protein [Streptomyces griseiscabiei]|uniref:Uncharacterized protein n=1 Tax=Streptomyces griseiscabiei TaxID=2993540 RepID=A0ABU4L7E8_9ACTN|nr:hypothetical protein [Streptomyces griseiscabiei]MBZ3906913.1 hypothetical protein [Streptomyces griseiscabiei]MDX2911704.1 hypothetical protein [Streptomyces griseiscabiei]
MFQQSAVMEPYEVQLPPVVAPTLAGLDGAGLHTSASAAHPYQGKALDAYSSFGVNPHDFDRASCAQIIHGGGVQAAAYPAFEFGDQATPNDRILDIYGARVFPLSGAPDSAFEVSGLLWEEAVEDLGSAALVLHRYAFPGLVSRR